MSRAGSGSGSDESPGTIQFSVRASKQGSVTGNLRFEAPPAVTSFTCVYRKMQIQLQLSLPRLTPCRCGRARSPPNICTTLWKRAHVCVQPWSVDRIDRS